MCSLPIADKLFHHLCFTWSNTNLDYQVWLDGEVVGRGSDLYKGGMIKHAGTLLIEQDQDMVGGKLDPNQSWTDQVSGLNLWGSVLSKSDMYYYQHMIRNKQYLPDSDLIVSF